MIRPVYNNRLHVRVISQIFTLKSQEIHVDGVVGVVIVGCVAEPECSVMREYHHGFPWIDLPIFAENGEPDHEDGIVKKVPGMYFAGRHSLHAMTSATLIGVGRDAERVAKAIASRVPLPEVDASPELEASAR